MVFLTSSRLCYLREPTSGSGDIVPMSETLDSLSNSASELSAYLSKQTVFTQQLCSAREAVDDCDKALALEPGAVKALLREPH